jgi:hypothetical protein
MSLNKLIIRLDAIHWGRYIYYFQTHSACLICIYWLLYGLFSIAFSLDFRYIATRTNDATVNLIPWNTYHKHLPMQVIESTIS